MRRKYNVCIHFQITDFLNCTFEVAGIIIYNRYQVTMKFYVKVQLFALIVLLQAVIALVGCKYIISANLSTLSTDITIGKQFRREKGL